MLCNTAKGQKTANPARAEYQRLCPRQNQNLRRRRAGPILGQRVRARETSLWPPALRIPTIPRSHTTGTWVTPSIPTQAVTTVSRRRLYDLRTQQNDSQHTPPGRPIGQGGQRRRCMVPLSDVALLRQ